MRNGKVALKKQETKEIERREAQSGREVSLLAAEAALEKKAEDVALIDLDGRSGIADYFLLMSGTNDRHVLALGDAVVARLKQEGVRVLGVEGSQNSQWVLIDAGDVVVHIFHADARSFYDIDGLWSDAARLAVPGASAASAGP